MKRYELTRSGVGAPSILMIVVILMLATFSVLSLSTANADQNLYQSNLDYTTAYYRAEADVQQYLRDIDAYLEAEQEGERISKLFNDFMNAPVSISDSQVVFSVPIDDKQSIAIQSTIITDQNGKRKLQIDSHTVVNTTEWEADFNMNLWVEE